MKTFAMLTTTLTRTTAALILLLSLTSHIPRSHALAFPTFPTLANPVTNADAFLLLPRAFGGGGGGGSAPSNSASSGAKKSGEHEGHSGESGDKGAGARALPEMGMLLGVLVIVAFGLL